LGYDVVFVKLCKMSHASPTNCAGAVELIDTVSARNRIDRRSGSSSNSKRICISNDDYARTACAASNGWVSTTATASTATTSIGHSSASQLTVGSTADSANT
jgi:hypothetical protein